MSKQVKTRNEQEKDYLYTIRTAVSAVREDGRPRRLILEIHPPGKKNSRYMRYRSYQDGDAIPWVEYTHD